MQGWFVVGEAEDRIAELHRQAERARLARLARRRRRRERPGGWRLVWPRRQSAPAPSLPGR